MESIKPHYLEWDSEFFSLKVGQVHVSDDQALSQLETDDFELIYVTAPKPLRNIPYPNMLLTDKKITFSKAISNEVLATNPSIVSFNGIIPNQTLYDLAIASGGHSRFKVDSSMASNDFERLYRLWIENSVNRQFADEVLVYMNAQDIVGFVTLRIQDRQGVIGLIAVDERHRGQRIGSQLMEASEQWCQDKGLSRLQVATQQDNTGAMQLYRKMGFEQIELLYYYHLRPSKR